jgi:hypothetical protein
VVRPPFYNPAVSREAILLLVTIATLTVYVVGVGGSTATAIRIREAWRHRKVDEAALAPQGAGEVVLTAPSLPRGLARLRLVGWLAFVPALVLAVFADRAYPWVTPVVVFLMVALNAFYFTAMQNMGQQLTLTRDGFRIGAGRKSRVVRWIHVTEFTGARVGAFSGMKMPEADEWQDPRVRPNVILFRLNRALTPTRRSLVHRLIGFTYYDGTIRNAFGVPTPQLLRVLRDWQRVALAAESLPLKPA